ncbi:MAG TPA: hypothetical protein VF755_28920 [Catenuloplanes sp.]
MGTPTPKATSAVHDNVDGIDTQRRDASDAEGDGPAADDARTGPDDTGTGGAVSAGRRWWAPSRVDVIAALSLVGMALFIVSPLWFHLDHELHEDPQDQAFFEWMMAHGARVVTDIVNPFISQRMNAPTGVNLMANTSVLAVSIPLAPVTLLFGPHVAFNTFLTLALTATALSWYFVLSRCFFPSRAAAWLGALFASFAPSMVSHAGGHPNIISQFLVPVIIWRTLRLREPGRAVRNGLLLAFFLIWQAFINLEVLFMTAVGLGVFCATVVIARREYRREIVPFLRALAVTAVVTGLVLAYPVYILFRGPYAYDGLPLSVRAFGADLGSFVAYARRSIAGSEATAAPLTQNASEENAFFGWGLVILFFVLLAWLRRNAVVIGLGVVALLFAIMSLGPQVKLNGQWTGVPSLWMVLQNLPVLHSAVPTRWALAIAPVVAILLALGVERGLALARKHPTHRRPILATLVTVLAMALVPLTPTPLLMRPMAPVPEFVLSGEWRKYVDDKHSVVSLPVADSTYPDPLRWSAFTGHDMRIARGYFLGPQNDPKDPTNRTALFTAPYRSTSYYFSQIRNRRTVNDVDNQRRKITLGDLRYWKASVVVLAPQRRDFYMKETMTRILGFEPQWVKGVWLWDVRHLVDNKQATLVAADDAVPAAPAPPVGPVTPPR